MKFLHPLNLELHDSRKLPKEQQLRDYMGQYVITDPYNLPDCPNLTQTIAESDHTDRPTDINELWTCSSFQKDGFEKITPEYLSPNSSIPYNHSNNTQFPQNISNQDFVNIYANTHSSYKNSYYFTDINMGRRLTRIAGFMSRCFVKYRYRQLDRLLYLLQEKGYTTQRNEFELLKEYTLRRKQYPGEPIYILCGNKSSEYYQCIYHQNKWNTAHLISPGSNSYSTYSPTFGSLSDYETAVFAKAQVKSHQNFLFEYHLKKVPRKWHISIASIAQSGLEIDDRIEEEKVIVPKGLSQFNFD